MWRYFYEKNANEGWQLLEQFAENSRHHQDSRISDDRFTHAPSKPKGMYYVDHHDDLSSKVDSLAKKLDYILSIGPNSLHHSPPSAIVEVCQLCCNPGHTIEECHQALQSMGSNEQACFTQGYGQQIYDDHFNPQNQGWKYHPNSSWGPSSQRVNSTPSPPFTRPPSNQYSSNRPSFPSHSYQTPTHTPHFSSPSPSSQFCLPPQSDPALQTILTFLEGQTQINQEQSKLIQSLTQQSNTQIQSLSKLEAQVGQLANQLSRRVGGKKESYHHKLLPLRGVCTS